MEYLDARHNEVARIAMRLDQKTDCPAKLMIAQWAIESTCGTKPVGKPGTRRQALLVMAVHFRKRRFAGSNLMTLRLLELVQNGL